MTHSTTNTLYLALEAVCDVKQIVSHSLGLSFLISSVKVPVVKPK